MNPNVRWVPGGMGAALLLSSEPGRAAHALTLTHHHCSGSFLPTTAAGFPSHPFDLLFLPPPLGAISDTSG